MKECFRTFPSIAELIIAIRRGGEIRKRTDPRARAKMCFKFAKQHIRKNMPRYKANAIEAVGLLVATVLLFALLFFGPAVLH